MSIEGALAFHQRLMMDEEFQQRAAAAAAGTEGGAATSALVQLGRSEGIDLTADELIAVQGAVIPKDEISDEHLGAVAGGTSMASIDLQNALQKQQQTMQTLSNVSKQLHDTAMAIVRKIG